jgi:hypothetical protein
MAFLGLGAAGAAPAIPAAESALGLRPRRALSSLRYSELSLPPAMTSTAAVTSVSEAIRNGKILDAGQHIPSGMAQFLLRSSLSLSEKAPGHCPFLLSSSRHDICGYVEGVVLITAGRISRQFLKRIVARNVPFPSVPNSRRLTLTARTEARRPRLTIGRQMTTEGQ